MYRIAVVEDEEQYREEVCQYIEKMAELRITIDQLETMTPSDKWPVPSYGDLLFSVR